MMMMMMDDDDDNNNNNNNNDNINNINCSVINIKVIYLIKTLCVVNNLYKNSGKH